MDFEQISDKEKEVLHIASVSESHLDFRKGDFGKMVEFYKYNDGELGIEISDPHNDYILNKEQIEFMLKWISYSR